LADARLLRSFKTTVAFAGCANPEIRFFARGDMYPRLFHSARSGDGSLEFAFERALVVQLFVKSLAPRFVRSKAQSRYGRSAA